MVELTSFVEQLHTVYAGIAQKIQELVVLLNEGGSNTDTQALAAKIENFLSVLARSIQTEKAMTKLVSSKQQKTRLLTSIQAELNVIKELQLYVKLSQKKKTPEIIKKINALYQEVEKEIKSQEAILKA